jgi:hypothetical protein
VIAGIVSTIFFIVCAILVTGIVVGVILDRR